MPKPAARLCLCLTLAAAAGGCMAAAPAAGARPRLILRPGSGPAGTRVTASLYGFRARSRGSIRFGRGLVARVGLDRRGRARVRFRVPRNARGRVTVRATFSVTRSSRRARHGRQVRRRLIQRAGAAFRVLAPVVRPPALPSPARCRSAPTTPAARPPRRRRATRTCS